MKRNIITITGVCVMGVMGMFVLGACQAPISTSHTQMDVDQAQVQSEILTVLHRQDAAWNAGDIETFMADYWDSEELRFASGGTVHRGWNNTLARYKKSYPDRAAMGQLSFDEIEVTAITPTDAVVFGHWQLKRESDMPNGLFTLYMKKQDGAWKIMSDHSSSAE